MDAALAVSWGFRRRRLANLVVAFVVAASIAAIPVRGDTGSPFISVLVRKIVPGDTQPEQEVIRLGGRVGRPLSIINGFTATVPATSLAVLKQSHNIHSVSLDRVVRPMHAVDGFDGATDVGSMYNTTKIVRAQDLWRNNITGRGIDVALIDSGVVPVNGLSAGDKVVNGPDLSFESQTDNLRYLDTYGHGTHLAGIIAGRGNDAYTTGSYTNHDYFVGVAPDARVVNVKVAESSGATDVSQVIAAIDWVVQHRNDNGLNIRVLNISFGTESAQSYVEDPLAFAAEVAWRSGIVVVAAAGNEGSSATSLSDPAYDPYVIAVGADNPNGTPDTSDDVIPSWSSRGNGQRNPSLVAPGQSIVSLRDVGSSIDANHPEGRVNTRFFKGSGTSQAAAVVSGAAALLLQQRPSLTPDQVKKLLTSTANAVPGVDAGAQGAGLINVRAASAAATPAFTQTHTPATGLGSLESARGSTHLSRDGVELNGEQDIFGAAWDANAWSSAAAAGSSWSGGTWNGNVWAGSDWSGSSWSSSSWSSSSWSSSSWSSSSWSSSSWSSSSWSSSSWSSSSWSSSSWSSSSWE
ncbi:MAG: S8 family serine peptidase [Actinomycetota bacterium]